jgi:hypothetical protein
MATDKVSKKMKIVLFPNNTRVEFNMWIQSDWSLDYIGEKAFEKLSELAEESSMYIFECEEESVDEDEDDEEDEEDEEDEDSARAELLERLSVFSKERGEGGDKNKKDSDATKATIGDNFN